MPRTRGRALVWLCVVVALGACQTAAPAVTPAGGTEAADRGAAAPRASIDIDDHATEGELVVTLPDGRAPAAPIAVEPLAPAATAALIARMEPPPVLDNAHAPSLRAPSAAPPSGATQPIALAVTAGKPVDDLPPGAAAPPRAVTHALTPPQITPQGEVAHESEIRVRFDEPMVDIAELGRAPIPPVTIAPAARGTWAWLDSRVLVFTAAGARLPQATELTVTVPAGVRALSGDPLGAPVVQQLATPPVALAGTYPASKLRPDSAIAVQLDQDVDPAAILARLRVDDPVTHEPLAFHAVPLADAELRWARNPSLQYDAARVRPRLGRAVLIAPDGAWPAGVTLRITLAAGAPSREGPRVSTRPSVVRFEVAPPMRVLGVDCEDKGPRLTGATCAAFGYLQVAMSNPIAPATYHAADVQIGGEDFQDSSAAGASVGLIAPEPVGRTYAIHVAGAIADVYGQALGGARDVSFTTSPEVFEPMLTAATGLQVLDPRFAIPQWVIEAAAVRSLHVRLFAVQPADYFAYEDFEAGARTTPPGRLVVDRVIEVGPRHGVTARIDLRPALGPAALGHVIAVVDAAPVTAHGADYFVPRAFAWFQVSKLGLVGRVDGDQAHAWVRDIGPTSFLAPTADAAATIITDDGVVSAAATTDAAGHVALPLLPARPGHAATDAGSSASSDDDDVHLARRRGRTHATTALLAVRTATDSTFAALTGDGHQLVRERDALWYATDDRFTYKPGETAYVKGWVRWTTTGVNPDVALPAAGDAITYTLSDARGTKLASGTAPLTDQGGFDLAVALPVNANLGTAQLVLTTRGQRHELPLEIEEFRAPAFAVDLVDDVTHAGATPLILGERLEMRAEAKYYAGGGLPGAAIRWAAQLVPTRYQPPGWDEFAFAPPAARGNRRAYPEPVDVTQDGALSGASAAGAIFGVAALASGWPAVLRVDATVSDVDRMAIRASSRPILVHPSAYYVGIRLQPDHDDQLEVVATDIDGAPVAGVPIAVDVEGVLGSERERADARVVEHQHCAVTSAAAPVRCAWRRGNVLNAYTATARVVDPRGRANATQYAIPWASVARDEPLRLTPDRATYKAGDVAHVELVSDVVPATAIVSFARNGVMAQRRLELTQRKTMIDVPIEPGFIAGVHVDVDRIATRRQSIDASAGPLPEETSASVELPVSIETARLVMTTRATQKILEPGGQATFEVTVRHGGAPVANAEVALIVVDEAILALSARQHADPLQPFYQPVDDGSLDVSTLGEVSDEAPNLAGKPGVTRVVLDSRSGIGIGGGGSAGTIGSASYGMLGHGSGRGAMVITSRKDFRANAVFSPRLHTDADGRVQLTVKMPDSLTRFRIVALATAGTRFFGKAEGTVITQRKLNARTVAPRFLTQGDAFALPVVVQNLDTEPRTVDVAVRAVNLIATGPTGQRVTVGGGQRAEVRFGFRTAGRGEAAVQTVATAGDFTDASTVRFPVYAPATTEAFATYGVVDDAPQIEQLGVPADILPDVGGVEIELASSQLQSLTDAFGYVYAYPFECAEQRSARMLATGAMADVLEAFATPGRPTRAELEAQRATDDKVLARDQKADGGWGYWQDSPSDAYVTQQVLRAIAGGAAGRVGGAGEKARGQAYVTRDAAERQAWLERRRAVREVDRDPREQDEVMARVSMVAADLSALAASGIEVAPRAAKLHEVATALAAYPVDAKARLLALVAGRAKHAEMRAALLAQLLSAIHETAAAATVTTTFTEAERLLLGSSTKTTALALEAIMREAPTHAVIPKLARGLLAARTRGRWVSTQENLAVLVAMRRYYDVYEPATPAFTGKVWLGRAGYTEHAFAGRSLETEAAHVGWPALAAGSRPELAFAKEGTGRLYYRVGITYAPGRADVPALEAGFLVRRTYAAVDDAGDVQRAADGRWHIKLGARVRVTVEALNTTPRYGVALVDSLPAGLEPVNTRLAVAERAAPGAAPGVAPGVATASSAEWTHVNMRDERAEAFASELAEGSHVFTYSARATTPGVFVAAPARAEEMYAPETFGRSAGVVVVVE